MSHANPPEHGITTAPAAHAGHLSFPPAEVEAFHAADRMAGTYIVSLLMSIFVLAIFGYLYVCFWVTR